MGFILNLAPQFLAVGVLNLVPTDKTCPSPERIMPHGDREHRVLVIVVDFCRGKERARRRMCAADDMVLAELAAGLPLMDIGTDKPGHADRARVAHH